MEELLNTRYLDPKDKQKRGAVDRFQRPRPCCMPAWTTTYLFLEATVPKKEKEVGGKRE